MKIEGQLPLKGTPAERQSAKISLKAEGKSFGSVFNKAIANPGNLNPQPLTNPIAETPSPVVAPPKPSISPDNTATDGPLKDSPNRETSHEENLETIKFRLKTGYYNSKPVTEALTEKLTGFFDELA